MHLLQKIAVLLALAQCCYSVHTNYVANVNCSSRGITFQFSHFNSDLYDETGLQIQLYTGPQSQLVTQYNPGSDTVEIDYDEGYIIKSTTVYGPANRPLMYNIEQPFFAVPLPEAGAHRNYTFGVYCTATAYDNVNITTNTTDDGHGNHGGDVITPQDHVENDLVGIRADGSSTIGDKLTYVLSLKDDTYAALVPVSCKYYNPSNEEQYLPFVSDSCPRQFPDDPDGYFGTVKQIGDKAREYQVDFRAFTFETKLDSFLGIDCDVLLCLTDNIDKCKLPCWGFPQGPTPAIGTTTAGPIIGTTTEGQVISTTEGPVEPTTAAGPTEAGPTTVAEPTTEGPTTAGEPTTTAVAEPTTNNPPRPVRMVARFHPVVKRDTTGLKDKDEPKSTTINEKKVMKINLPGVDPTPSSTSVCTDTSLLSALYAVIGILAILVAILVGSLSYIACARRRQSTKADHYYDGPYVPSIAK